MTTQEKHVFCAWCWRAVPAHGGTYIPRPHPDTLGKSCRGEAMCGATTYSVGTPPCERGDARTFAFAYLVPSASDIEIVLAERSAEAEELRAENDRVAGLYLAAQAERAQAESDASHAHSEWAHERAANRRLREEVARLRRLLAAYHCADDGAWPLLDSMDRLASAADHLLDDHNCDEEGNEEVRFAIATARQVVAAVRSAMRHGREIDEDATAVDDGERGIFPKYKITRADGTAVDDSYFILRDTDPHAAAALASFPEARATASGFVVRKLLRFDRVGYRSAGEPDPVPVYGDPLDVAAVLALGMRRHDGEAPGFDERGVGVATYAPAWSVRAALLAYARSCADESPALADDLRAICSSRLPDDQLAAATADAAERGMPTCGNCGCVCDPEGAGGVCMCDAACRFCSATDKERRATKKGER